MKGLETFSRVDTDEAADEIGHKEKDGGDCEKVRRPFYFLGIFKA